MNGLSDYKGTLPYASELFGVYQPLLGWQSRLTQDRLARDRASGYHSLTPKFLSLAQPALRVQVLLHPELNSPGLVGTQFNVAGLEPAIPTRPPGFSAAIDSAVTRLLREQLGDDPPAGWTESVAAAAMKQLLDQLADGLRNSTLSPGAASYVERFLQERGFVNEAGEVPLEARETVLRQLFDRECRVAGYLTLLAQAAPHALAALLFRPQPEASEAIKLADPLSTFGQEQHTAVLSPIGVIHLYRQYFFEFDSFLGPPVGHVWISPGGSVDLVEVNTRKVLTERSVELLTETTQRTESSTTVQDDLADAVKEENSSDAKLGFTNTSSLTTPVFSDTAVTSYSLDNSNRSSRETVHKQMRQQSEKLSSEIKRNFKTTFRTSSEITDTTSKRYVIQNTTDRLINYELRRKMRKVGVQVQDVGVQLCWHTFVDNPGRELGIGQLVHIGQPPELSDLTIPEQPVVPDTQVQDITYEIPFVGINTDDADNAYTDGVETEVGWPDSVNRIQADFDKTVRLAVPGYTLTDVSIEAQGADANISARVKPHAAAGTSQGIYTAHLDYVNWQGRTSIAVKARLIWEPDATLLEAARARYTKEMETYEVAVAKRYQDAFIQASRERISMASRIAPRAAEDLREEERTVVYRRLITQLMRVGGAHHSEHVVSELVRSIFDVDKMLYFVASEWWVPRRRSAARLLEGLSSSTLVSWGGGSESGRDNYYITENSAPARLGSSLGWLLQLDGDNVRNALLNSPWVRAVIPIRLGQERAALNWLRQADVEGEDGLSADYVAVPDDPVELQSTADRAVTVSDALDYLIDRVQESEEESRTPLNANPLDPDGPDKEHYVGSLPTESVFEHGFYPLQGGVRFNPQGTAYPIFSQWLEILPTDQVAAVEVDYDPRTLQVRTPPTRPGDEPPAERRARSDRSGGRRGETEP
jgi:hypothetical protein